MSLVWVFLVYSFLAVYIGRTMDLPEWVARATPFGLLPNYPTDAFDWPLAIALVGVSVAIAAVGAIVYRQRDVS
jgi:ABC-2 type transport system permease protein